MESLFELLKDQPLAIITFGVVLALIVGVRYLGLWQGQNAGPTASSGSAQVAAVIVDPTALNKAAEEVAGLTVAITDANVTARAHASATDRLAEKIDDLAAGVDDLRTELIRSSAKLK